MNAPEPTPFTADWPEPLPSLLKSVSLPAPPLPLDDVLCPRLAAWVRASADSKGAPADYVFAAMLVTAGAIIGNTRCAQPAQGWNEAPILWGMCIGLPSAGKSPAIDAVLNPLRDLERPIRKAAEKELSEWEEAYEVAKLREQAWKEATKAAIKDGGTAPERPSECDAGPAPHIPRLVVNDATIERLGQILSKQPRGTLQMRDELAGWLEGMQRYSGSSDRPFWLEAFGGRSFTVERMGRPPITIDHLAIGVLGGIQPDRLKSLLFKSDDDGLLARFLPIWPEPAPITTPKAYSDENLFKSVLEKLWSLEMEVPVEGNPRPWKAFFTEDAKQEMTAFRKEARSWEAGQEGLLLSFIGKLSGLAARLTLVLAYLNWAAKGGDEPHNLDADQFKQATHLIKSYFLPMAQRAYAEATLPKAERAARRLVGIIREQGWRSFTSRDVLRLDRQGLGRKSELDPALEALEEGDCIRFILGHTAPKGGRPQRLYNVNPALHRQAN